MSENSVEISSPLSQGVGYGIVIGVGLTFAAGMPMSAFFVIEGKAKRQA